MTASGAATELDAAYDLAHTPFSVTTESVIGAQVIAPSTSMSGDAPRANQHGEALVPHIAAALSRVGIKPKEVDAVVVGIGPGPFTGLRVGMVTAAAWGHAVGCRVYGVCTLDAVATTALAERSTVDAGLVTGEGDPLGGPVGKNFLVATDARRKEVYWAVYSGSGVRLSDPAVDKPANLASRLRALSEQNPAVTAPTWVAGAGASLYRETIALPTSETVAPSVAGLAMRAGHRVMWKAPSEQLAPLYLRRPDAVEPTTRKSVLV